MLRTRIIIGTLFTITKKVKSRTIHHTTNSFKAQVKLPPPSKPAPTKRIADQNAGHELFFLPRRNDQFCQSPPAIYANFSKI